MSRSDFALDTAPEELLPPGVTVVTSTRRLAHHLRSRHDAACLALGLTSWLTPDVVPWEDWLRRQFLQDRAEGRTSRRWLPQSHARLAWARLVRQDESVGHVLAPAGLGAAAYRSWTLLHQYLVPDSALEDADVLETRVFGGWVRRFRRWLDEQNFVDAAQASRSVGSWSRGTRIQFAGFDQYTPAQQQLRDRLQACDVDVSDRPAISKNPCTASKVQVIECNDFEAELLCAARWSAALLMSRPDARIALLVPGLSRARGRVRRVLDRVLVPATAVTGGPPPESLAYELAAARPLIDRPVVAAGLAWLEATLGEADLAAFSALLLGPHDGSAGQEFLSRAALDVELRRAGSPMRGLSTVAARARRSSCPETADRLERLAARSRGWSQVRPPSDWAQEFSRALWDIGWPGAGASSEEHQAVERWRALMSEFGAADDITGGLPVDAALGALRELAATTAFEPQDIAAPLLVIDPDSARGMQFDAAWVCGLEAAHWPPPMEPDPFLPREWQIRCGMPGASAELAEAEARRSFRSIAGSAPEVGCSVPRFEDDAPLLPSALVVGLPRISSTAAWLGLDATSAQFDARPLLQSSVDGALPAFPGHAIVRGGARMLELQAACPFRAAVELRLGGRPLESVAPGIAPAERGKLVHSMLQAFWREVRDQACLLSMSLEARASLVARLSGQVLEQRRAGSDAVQDRLLELERGWLETRVLELLEHETRREPFTVHSVETPHVLDVGGVQVRVVIDRVDRLADGTYAFIDYKTGANTRFWSWLGERPESPQLPLYVRTAAAQAVSAVAFGVVRTGATRYTGFARNPGLFNGLQPFEAGKPPFQEYSGWKDMLAQWRGRLDVLAQEHADGEAHLAPDPARACRRCHLPGLCRSRQAFGEDVGADAKENVVALA